MLEDVPVHTRKNETAAAKSTHQRNLSLDFKHLKDTGGPSTCSGHQRNRSLDSVLQRIPEDLTPTTPRADAGSDDSGIHAPLDDERAPPAARSRDSLDSGNPEDTTEIRSKDLLLRLFESDVFDIHMALGYLFNSKEHGVQSYLANKLFSFPEKEVDFYLPQLACLVSEDGTLSDLLQPYLTYRCRRHPHFALRLTWMLSAFGGDSKKSRARRLKDSILAESGRTHRGHQRSQSDASALRPVGTAAHLGDLSSGRGLDAGCICGERVQCLCGAPKLAPQVQFIKALTNIGRKLAAVTDRERRNARLREELATLDLNLPARVWLPLHEKPHYVLRIPNHAAAVLSSKNKAPYILYIEVLDTDLHSHLPSRLLPAAPPAPYAPPVRLARSEDTLPVPDDCWSDPDAMSLCSTTSSTSNSNASASACNLGTTTVLAGDVRRRLVAATAPNYFRHDPADPSALPLKESWESRLWRMRSSSPYHELAGWRLLGCIVKVGDDLRHELLAAQLLKTLSAIWELERVDMRLAPYEILCIDDNCGLIQPVLNSVSIHQIKKQSGASLAEWLELEHGPPTSEGYLRARDNFVRSAAGYALTSYLLQLKDRHDGNILLDSEGHIVHVDFGYILSMSPKNLNFERSPFKLTSEFVEVMGGSESDMFGYFKILILRGLIATRKHHARLLLPLEIVCAGGQLSCLSRGARGLRSRLQHAATETQLVELVDTLVHDAHNSLSTKLYDNYQYYTNGIL